MYHRCTQKMLAVVEDKCLRSPWCMLALSYKSLCSYLFLAFYFNFFSQKNVWIERQEKRNVNKKKFWTLYKDNIFSLFVVVAMLHLGGHRVYLDSNASHTCPVCLSFSCRCFFSSLCFPKARQLCEANPFCLLNIVYELSFTFSMNDNFWGWAVLNG